MNEFYRSLGYLVLGTRLRRLSENMLVDINDMYAEEHKDFDAFWFPIFFILSQHKEVTNKFISDELMVSHSAVSQLLSAIQAKGFIKMAPSKEDARKKIVSFTPAGEKLQKEIGPLWKVLDDVIKEWVTENDKTKEILRTLTVLEKGLKKNPLKNRIKVRLDKKNAKL